MSVTLALSVESLTARTALIAGLAIVALLLVGWRKPARAQLKAPRAAAFRSSRPIPVEQQDTPTYHRAGPIRRLLAAAGSGGIALVTGAVLAVVVAFAIAWAVISLTSLLQQ